MRITKPIHVCLIAAMLPSLAPHGAAAQAQAVGQAPATVEIIGARPVVLPAYRAIDIRIRTLLSRQSMFSGRNYGSCLMMTPTARSLSRYGNFPIDNRSMDMHIACARNLIFGRDTSLRRGLEAFERQDYAAARALFEAAYDKMGTEDAALMLARMQFDGLGTPVNKAQAIKRLQKVADGYFNPWTDTLRFNPDHPRMNARIEAAMMLARTYEQGDGVTPDPRQARHWYAKAAEYGYDPAQVLALVPALKPAAVRLDTAAARPAIAAASTPTAPRPIEVDPTSLDDAPAAQALPPLLALAVDAALPAAAPEPSLQADPEKFIVVRVSGLRAVPWKSYRAMRAALAAYRDYRAVLAPDAVFRFALLPPPGTKLPENFALRVRTKDGREFPIPLDNRELFDLPALPDADRGADLEADLVSNLKGGRLRIGLLVHSAGVPPEQERLGDVRLRYVINQAIANVDGPGEESNCWRTKTRSHCKFGRITLWHNPRAPANGATIVEGERRAALASDHDLDSPSYKMPLSGGGWGNDAIIAFDYKRLLRPLALSEVAIYNGSD